MSKKTTKKTSITKSSGKPSRPVKHEKPAAASDKRRMLILFGLDESKKPRAAKFEVDDNLGHLAAAADSMDLIICEVKTSKLADLATKLPSGRLHASGSTFVPYIRQDLYDKIVEAAGPDAASPTEPPSADGAPRSFEEIGPGHLVIAQEDLETGWWEAIVFACDDDMLTLRYRDYPRLPKFRRHRTAVALLSPPATP